MLKVTVWCALSSYGVIGPYYFTKTIAAAEYKKGLNDYLIPYVHRMGKIENFWFKQDGARPHRTAEVFQVIEENYQHRIADLDADKHTGHIVEWLLYSPDLNPLNFLSGNLKF